MQRHRFHLDHTPRSSQGYRSAPHEAAWRAVGGSYGRPVAAEDEGHGAHCTDPTAEPPDMGLDGDGALVEDHHNCRSYLCCTIEDNCSRYQGTGTALSIHLGWVHDPGINLYTPWEVARGGPQAIAHGRLGGQGSSGHWRERHADTIVDFAVPVWVAGRHQGDRNTHS